MTTTARGEVFLEFCVKTSETDNDVQEGVKICMGRDVANSVLVMMQESFNGKPNVKAKVKKE
jgi:hypothetical protein